MKEICNSLQHPESVGQNTVHISQRLAVSELFSLKKDPSCIMGELHDCAYKSSSSLQSQFICIKQSSVFLIFFLFCFLVVKNS